MAVYEARAGEWRDRRAARFLDRVDRLNQAVAPGATVADLGCGAGLHLPNLPRPAVALDAAYAMVAIARDTAPDCPGVVADLEMLPYRRGALGGAWARASYLHVARDRLPWALMELHHALAVGSPVHLTMMSGAGEGSLPDDDFAGRFFARWTPDDLGEVVTGAGFEIVELVHDGEPADSWIHVLARRERTLPDVVGPAMRLLVCGLNPSLNAADAGFGFAGPGNRFWPAAVEAGIVARARARARDPRLALAEHGIGMTDLVKRASARASELTVDDYRRGVARVERLVRWLRPRATCFVGLAGWRAAVDRRAQPGPQADSFGGRPAYVMPSTSGLNARVPIGELVDHLRAAAELADTS